MMKKNTRTIFVSNISSNANAYKVREVFSKIGPLQKCYLTHTEGNEEYDGSAIITYVSDEDATKAVKELNKATLMGNNISVKFMKKIRRGNANEHLKEKKPIGKKRSKSSDTKKKKGRIVIRNLSYKVTEAELKKYFEKFGNIKEVSILKYPDGRLKGVAFLEYTTVFSALKSIKELNLKFFMGRPIAVDLAASKQLYEGQNSIKEEPEDELESAAASNSTVLSNIKQEPNDSDVSEESKPKTKEDEDIENYEDVRSSESEDDDEIKMESDDEHVEHNSGDEDNSKQPSKTSFEHKPVSRDVLEGKTVFIRNIGFSSTEEKIKELLSEFGELKYVMFCMDHNTQRFKGSAFAQFVAKEGCSACLEAFEDPVNKSLFTLDGRMLSLMKAVGRTEIQKISNEKKKDTEKKDKRNLYLAREGVIREGTKAAYGVSRGDMLLRTQREIVKRKMLANYNIFISSSRLCIHNIPSALTDKELLSLFKKNSTEGAIITECRIMRNLYDLDENGKGKSKGYGFVTFSTHQDALAALRAMNNSPNIFTPKQRPVIEFSLENKAALKAKENRLKKSVEKNTLKLKSSDSAGSDMDQIVEGEMTELLFMGSKYDTNKKGKAALATHIGPKIRHKDRNDKQGKITRNKINNSLRNARQSNRKKRRKDANNKFKKGKKLKKIRA